MKKPKKEVKSKLLEGIKLQLFSDSGDGDSVPPNTTDQEPSQDTPPTQTEDKTFNQDDVNDIVAKRLAREKVKFEEEYKAKLETEKQEAEKLAKLSEAERQKAILDKQQQEFETERAEFQREKIELEVTKQMASKNLPIEFAPLLVTEDADSSFENIKSFEKNWQEALEKAVNEKLKGNTPKAGGSNAEQTGIGARLAESRKTQQTIKENPYF